MDMIWYDSEVLNGRGTRTEHRDESVYGQGPVNKRPLPCGGCPLYDQCMVDATACAAFRNWASKGDYRDEQRTKLLRGIK